MGRKRSDKRPAMSQAETEIMRLLWSQQEATVQALLDALPPKRDIGYATVQTLVRRLEGKGYVQHRREGKAYVYFPAAEREEVVRHTVRDFVDRLFGGDRAALMLHLADESELTDEQVRRLRKMIDRARDGQEDNRG